MLKHKAKSAVVWSGLDLLLRQGMSFVISIILARLLAPEEFGTIALLSLFLGIAQLFVDAGFSSALIQKQDITHDDESTVFWFNFAAGLVVTAVLFAFSPWIADFFALPVLMPLTMLMACNILISAMGSIHRTLLTKRLDFKTPMKIGVISSLISGCVGVYMAWAGFGVWSLAGQALVGTVVGTVMLWFFSPWLPAFIFSRDSFKKLFGFSGYLFVSWLLDTLYQRGYTLLLGKFYGIHDLGIYNRADNTQQLPSNIITGVLSRVAFPLFSSVNSNKERLRRGVRLSIRSITLITAPAMTGLAVLAKPFMLVVFGEQWLSAAPILQVLCVVGILYPLQVINLNVLQAQGHANLFFRLEVVKKTIGTILLISGSFFGLMGFAWASAIRSVTALIINSHYTKKHLDYGVSAQIMDCIPSIALSILMAIGVLLADSYIDVRGITKLTVLAGFGATFYLVGNVVLGSGAFKEALGFIKSGARA
ncbi:MAG: lipopolysaccharide biosynthesis protein [Geobacteraceae bacterium]|nr:lipopolysaccharide biosynthesis protein [Geobacteraceae bacterium]